MLSPSATASVGVLLATVCTLSAQKLERVGDSIIDSNALCFAQGTWGRGVNGQSFQQDALTSFHGWQYSTYYDSARRLCVARRRGLDPQWEVVRFGDHHIKGNDTHNVAVMGISAADGTLHLSFDHHGHPLRYRVSLPGVAERPQTLKWTTNLFGPITNELEPGRALSRVTYPRFVRTPQGGLHFGCRIGGSGNGDKYLAEYDPASRTWKRFGAYISGQGRYGDSGSRNPYLNGLNYDHRGRLHVTWCWRESGDPMTNHDLLYAWSEDAGRSWLNNAGEKVGERGRQALSLDSAGLRVADIRMNHGLMNATTQAVDSRDRIHLVTLHLADGEPPPGDWETARRKTHFFHYWRDDRAQWHRQEMKFNGGRPQLWFDPADNALLIFVGDRYNPSEHLTIAGASARNRWTDWRILHQEEGPFTGQPQIDRYQDAAVLSVYIQQEPPVADGTGSPLRVLTFRSRE